MALLLCQPTYLVISAAVLKPGVATLMGLSKALKMVTLFDQWSKKIQFDPSSSKILQNFQQMNHNFIVCELQLKIGYFITKF